MPQKYVTVKEAADYLGVRPSAIYWALKHGRFHAKRVKVESQNDPQWRIPFAEVKKRKENGMYRTKQVWV